MQGIGRSRSKNDFVKWGERPRVRRPVGELGAAMNFTRAERISLKLHPELNEKWVQKLIADDPSILGLGDLVLRDKERMQPRAGRLDLLLEDPDPDTERRYEVEIQLGSKTTLIFTKVMDELK